MLVARFLRAHLRADPTLTALAISEITGVSVRTIRDILNGKTGRTVNLATAQRLTRLTQARAATRKNRRLVSGVGARRRVEALLVQGWSARQIAAQTGLSPSTLPPANLLGGMIHQDTADRIATAYQAMRNTLPAGRQSARARARRRGYAPWSAWGSAVVMDDPAAVPDWTMIQDAEWARAIRLRWAPAQASRAG